MEDGIVFGSREVAALLGMRKPKFEQWVSRGLIVPSDRSKGSGHEHGFTATDVLRAHVIQELHKRGVRLVAARDYTEKRGPKATLAAVASECDSLEDIKNVAVSISIHVMPVGTI